MRVTLVIAGLTAGGAERIMCILANAWAAKGWPVTLLSLDSGLEPPFYPLHRAVNLRSLDLQRPATSPFHAVWSNLDRIRVLRRAIVESQPDGVLSFVDRTNVLTLLATAGLRVPVVVSERVDPAKWPIGPVWTRLRQLTYRRATTVAVQSENARVYFADPVRARIQVIPNPVILPLAGEGEREQSPSATGQAVATSSRTLVAMGRLVEQKGFDLLIEAFARVVPRHPDWSLRIWGDGPLRPSLEAMVERLELRGRVSLPGRTQDAYGEMRRSNLFVLSSRFEGFPNVLCEAMACGLPVVSFDCPSGPADIIRPGIDGELVPPEDIGALAATLDRLMGDPGLRARLGARAVEVVDRFRIERILALWEAAFVRDAG